MRKTLMSISISSYLVKKKITFLPIRVAHFLKKNLNGKHLTILITMLFPKVWLQAEYKLTTTGTFRNISGITEGGVLSKKKKRLPGHLNFQKVKPNPHHKKKKKSCHNINSTNTFLSKFHLTSNHINRVKNLKVSYCNPENHGGRIGSQNLPIRGKEQRPRKPVSTAPQNTSYLFLLLNREIKSGRKSLR